MVRGDSSRDRALSRFGGQTPLVSSLPLSAERFPAHPLLWRRRFFRIFVFLYAERFVVVVVVVQSCTGMPKVFYK